MTRDQGRGLAVSVVPLVDMAQRARTHVMALASSLEQQPLDCNEWDGRVAAMAGSLGIAGAPFLVEFAERSTSRATEMVAATELLRSLVDGRAGARFELTEGVLVRLRAEASRGDPMSATRVVALRSLSAHGARWDLLRLSESLLTSTDPQERSIVGWSLSGAPRGPLLGCLAEVLSTASAPEALERVLCTLSTWDRLPEWDASFPEARAIVLESATRALRDGQAPDQLRLRALQVLVSHAPRLARSELLEVVAAPETSLELRRLAARRLLEVGEPCARDDLEVALGEVDLNEGVALVLAEALARDASARGAATRGLSPLAFTLLEEAALDGEDPLQRRQALFALAELEDPRVQGIVERILSGDPSPPVRAAAEHASSSRTATP